MRCPRAREGIVKVRRIIAVHPGSLHTGSMSLPVEEIASVGEALAAIDLTPPRNAMIITPPPAAMTRLQRCMRRRGNWRKKPQK